jgi:PAS domain S-box-containing protein
MLRLQSPGKRYGVAAAVTALACLPYLAAGPPDVGSDLKYFGFTLAVLISAILGGLGPGLLSTGLAAFVSAYLLLPPIFSLHIDSEERTTRLLLFAVEGVLLTFASHAILDTDTDPIGPPSWPRRYLPAALFVSVATGLKLLAFRNLEAAFPFTFFYAAIAAGAWIGGFGPGLTATLLSSLSARYFFLDPPHTLSVFSGSSAARLSLFVSEGLIVSLLTAKQFSARRIVNDAMAQIRSYRRRMSKSLEDVRALRVISRDVIWEWNLITDPADSGKAQIESAEPAPAPMDVTSWFQHIHPQDRLAVLASLRSAVDEGRGEWFGEYRRLRREGEYTRVSDHAYIVRDDGWNPVRVVGRSADVTEVRNATLVLQNGGPYKAIFEENPLAILATDRWLHILEANGAACNLLGYGKQELTKLHAEELFEEEIRGSLMEMLLSLDTEHRSRIVFEEECLRANGEVFRAKISAATIAHGEGTAVDRMITIEEAAGLK